MNGRAAPLACWQNNRNSWAVPPNNRLQATVGGLGVDMLARWAFAHRA